MLEQSRRIGRVLARRAIERRLARLRRKADHCPETVGGLAGGRDRLGPAHRRQPLAHHRDRCRLAWQQNHLPRRKRVGPAGIEEDDGHRRRLAQRLEQRLHRDHAGAGRLGGRHVGIGRREKILALGLDAVARIIDQRDIGVFRFTGKARNGVAHLLAIGVEHPVDLESEIAQQPVDVARLLLRVGQHRQLLVFALADDEGNAAQRLVLRRDRTGQQHKEHHQRCPKSSSSQNRPTGPDVSLRALSQHIGRSMTRLGTPCGKVEARAAGGLSRRSNRLKRTPCRGWGPDTRGF